MKGLRKKVVCVDFDGVLHSYTSGWKGPRVIPDPPVPGALKWLCEMAQDERFQVCIYSSRSRYWGGRRAMKRWLREQYADLVFGLNDGCPDWLYCWAIKHTYLGYWEDVVDWAITRLLWAIQWPTKKPPAWITIDDRAWRFTGVFPDNDIIAEFRPWYK